MVEVARKSDSVGIIIGFAVQAGVVDGAALCGMFNQVIAGTPTLAPIR